MDSARSHVMAFTYELFNLPLQGLKHNIDPLQCHENGIAVAAGLVSKQAPKMADASRAVAQRLLYHRLQSHNGKFVETLRQSPELTNTKSSLRKRPATGKVTYQVDCSEIASTLDSRRCDATCSCSHTCTCWRRPRSTYAALMRPWGCNLPSRPEICA